VLDDVVDAVPGCEEQVSWVEHAVPQDVAEGRHGGGGCGVVVVVVALRGGSARPHAGAAGRSARIVANATNA
jgi:hypothetical protein